ncbi:MAG: trypsin-like peptidase domain-containing protein [Alphaproteobacteria bacterium]|nr:trypsin-like peptidase domain-containing protein [Alphaproteobacteria bacterium]
MRRAVGAVACLVAFASATSARADDPLRRTPVVVAVERATPAVVTVRVEIQRQSPFFPGAVSSDTSEGSGVIIGRDGVVLTNAHVVAGARSINVHLLDGRAFEADVVAQDPSIDLAVLNLTGAHGLPVIPVGDSSDLLLGEPVIAIGNPFGLGLTVSTGVVASTGRDVNVGDGPVQTYIQTDAAINPGNSGGALVNIHGELIGINTFIHQAAEGIGFAIPVNRARKISEDLISFGEVQLPWLGMSVVDVPRRRLRGALADGAMLVQRVHDGGPASAAGIVPGDLVYELDGHRVSTRADLNARLSELTPGVTVKLGVAHDDALGTRSVATRKAPGDLGAAVLRDALAIHVVPARGGLQVDKAGRGGTWVNAGLAVGDLIIGVDGQRVRSEEELVRLLQQARARHRGSAWFTVARGNARGTVEIGL